MTNPDSFAEALTAVREGDSVDRLQGLLTAELCRQVDADGRTLLHHAVISKILHTVECILRVDATELDAVDEGGWSALHMAASVGNVEVLLALFDRGRQMDAPQFKHWLDLQNQTGQTALFYAVSKNHSRIVQELIDAGSDCGIRDALGQTVLHRAATLGRTATAVELFGNPVFTNAFINSHDNQGNTPLHLAVEEGHEGFVRLLGEVGADPNVVNSDSLTPFQCTSNPNILKILRSFSEK